MNKESSDPGEFPSAIDAEGSTPPAGAQGRALCGDLDMRIDRNGIWYYHGSPIGRKELVRLFASVLTRGKDGDYWLVTPAEMGRIEVEDVPFMAVELFRTGAGKDQILSLRTNVDRMVTVDEDHPLRVFTHPETGEPAPYVTVDPRIEARIARPVYYELVEIGGEETVDHESVYGVWSSGRFFALGSLDPDR